MHAHSGVRDDFGESDVCVADPPGVEIHGDVQCSEGEEGRGGDAAHCEDVLTLVCVCRHDGVGVLRVMM